MFCCCKNSNEDIVVIDNKHNDDDIIIIDDIDTSQIKRFTFNGETFIAKPCEIYDGDTLSFVFIHNKNIIKWRCRCKGYDSPEMKPSLNLPNRDVEIKKAKEAKNRFIELLNNEVVKIKCYEFDKYGRVLVDIFKQDNCNKSINQQMIDEGHGYPYDGGKKRSTLVDKS
tara:strand:+ start:753 stop:1259 length:507 start_codon:yes stop_codon:yes gene_type:complete